MASGLDFATAVRQSFTHSIYLAAPPAGLPHETTPLTSREVEILRLVAEGHSNRRLAELLSVSEQAAELSEWLSRPHLPLRTFAGLGILAVLIIVVEILLNLHVRPTFTSIAEFLQGSEAAINEVVLLGISVFFFLTLETRLKRRRALHGLMGEFKASSAIALAETRRLAFLDAFFASPPFHRAIQAAVKEL